MLFFNLKSFAQTTFDSAQRLVSIEFKNGSIAPPVAPLNDTGTFIKEQVRMLLLKKLQESLRIFKSNNYKKQQHIFYQKLWNSDSASQLNYLKEVETALQSGKIASLQGHLNSSFNNIFNKHLSDTAMVFRWLPLNNLEGVLVKKDVFKNFITDYYNETLPSIKGGYVNKEDIIEASYYHLEQIENLNSLLIVNNGSLQKFRKTLYDSLRNYHTNLTSASSPFTKSLNLLRNDWFKQWFWVTGGEIRINPIDFGIDTIIGKYVSNLSNLGISNRTSESIFLERRLDSLEKNFISSKPNMAIVEKWINKVSVPADTPYFQFSAIDKIKFPNNEIHLKRNLHFDETKTLVIHNIPADRKAGMREDRKAIPNRSNFQEGIDEVISNLGELAKAYGQITGTPWLLVSNFLSPTPKYDQTSISPKIIHGVLGVNEGGKDRISIKVKVDTTYKPFTVSGFSDDDFLDAIKKVLSDNNLLVDPIFTNVFGGARITYADAASGYKDEFEKKFDRYLALITKDAVNQILEDSFMVAGMIHIYNTATSPLLMPIKTNRDNTFRYYSSTIQTTAVDSTVENQVRPYTVISKTNSDTVFIGKFNYKIGRTKRFTLSAGLAYTLNSYDQSVAKAENGSISITNSSQQFRLMVGLNVYFGKGLYSLNNDLGNKFSERWYAFFGIGIPNSLENLYVGIGRDLYPGLKVTAGVHLAKHNKYMIQNNRIVEERLQYKPAGPFVSVAIDPISLVNLLNIFKK
jgi:hypothetical protein